MGEVVFYFRTLEAVTLFFEGELLVFIVILCVAEVDNGFFLVGPRNLPGVNYLCYFV